MANIPTRKLFEDALKCGTLKGLVDQMRLQGLSQAAIYVLFASFAAILREEGRDADEETLEDDAMDFIWGGCSKSKMWFDHTLNDREINAWREANPDSTKLL